MNSFGLLILVAVLVFLVVLPRLSRREDRRVARREDRRVARRERPPVPRQYGKWIVVDGSNVLYWDSETPDFHSVRSVIDILKQEGFDPVVWFDANVGYLIGDRYLGPEALAKKLNLPERRVFVAPKGTPADPLLIKDAKKLKASVVTNDRYRDWEKEFPVILKEGFLIRGKITSDEILLELGQ